MTSNDEYVIRLLVERGFLTHEQVEAAANSMKAANETTLDVLVSSGTIGEDEVLGTVADQFGLKYCHVNAEAIDAGIVKEIPADIAKKYGVVPVVADEDSITVALSDPMGYDAIDSLRYVLHGRDVEAVISPRAEIQAAMSKLYADDEPADVQTRDEMGGDAYRRVPTDRPSRRRKEMPVEEAVESSGSQPKPKRKPVAGKLEAIHAQESFDASGEKALRVADDLESMRLGEAAKVVRDGYAETLTYTRFPVEHWRRIRTNNAVERLDREIGRRTRVVGTFPDGKSALMLVTARLKYVADSEWGSRRYLDVTLLEG